MTVGVAMGPVIWSTTGIMVYDVCSYFPLFLNMFPFSRMSIACKREVTGHTAGQIAKLSITIAQH